jgi:hypothetical protein
MCNVHLVGSIGLDSVREVFATVGRGLRPELKRIPDGEPGSRRLWISYQYPLLRSSPFLRPDPSGAVRASSGFPLLCLAEGVEPQDVSFGELGYAREARTSYQDFLEARQRGDIEPGVRFQVCLPTPMGVIYAFCPAPDLVSIEPAYEAAMIREAVAICQAIPHEDLCIQWDFCTEMLMLDGQPQSWFPKVGDSAEEIMARMKRLCAQIPDDVELGFHLCYGDFGAKHFLEPIDATAMVEAANGIVKAVRRPIAYFHFPAPVSRTDEAYYKPFKDLQLAPQTEIYLGCLHMSDGVAGAERRVAAARKFMRVTGVATECGIARARKPEFVQKVLRLYADAAAHLDPA